MIRDIEVAPEIKRNKSLQQYDDNLFSVSSTGTGDDEDNEEINEIL